MTTMVTPGKLSGHAKARGSPAVALTLLLTALSVSLLCAPGAVAVRHRSASTTQTSSSAGADSGGASEAGAGVTTSSNVFIVELSGDPQVLGGDSAAMGAEKNQLAASLARKGIRHRVRHTYSTLLNGVALALEDPAKAPAVAALPGVKAVHRTRRMSLPKPVLVADAFSDGGPTVGGEGQKPGQDMTNVTEVHQILGITGKGVKVGIIDSGIDYTNPAFGVCTQIGKGCRVAFGYDFVGDAYDGGASGNATRAVPVPDKDPNDCYFHGTHVAGIVGGRDTKFVGVAPDVILGAYKVSGCEGYYETAVVVSALEKAYADGMDVINLSLGFIGSWAEGDLTAIVANRLASMGVLVVAAEGDDGVSGLWQSGTPALASGALGVASFEATAGVSTSRQVSPGDETETCRNASFYDYFRSPLGIEHNPTHSLPVPGTGQFTVPSPNPSDGQVSNFSSWGPSPNVNSLKPDLGAPGYTIFSLPETCYPLYAGTSVASPFVAGVGALYIAARTPMRPRTVQRNSAVLQALRNSAVPRTDAATGLADPVARQGAGLINALKAIRGNTSVTPPFLSLGFIPKPGPSVWKVDVKNKGSIPMKYSISHVGAASVNGTAIPNPVTGNSSLWTSVSFSSDTLTLGPGSSVYVLVTVTFDPNQPSRELWIHSGYILVTPLLPATPSFDYSPVFVPYQAIVASPAAAHGLRTGPGGPDLQSLTGYGSDNNTMYTLANETATFTFNATTKDVPMFRFQVLFPLKRITFQLYSFHANKFQGYVDSQDFIQGIPDNYFSSTWKAPRYLPAVRKNPWKSPNVWTLVPDGSYYVIISAEKALGGSLTTAQNTETWRSPKIVIKTEG